MGLLRSGTPKRRPALASQAGFSLAEAIVAMVVGLIVLGAAMGFLITQMRTLGGTDVRDSLSRNSRYVAISLRHDLQAAGIDIESTPDLGTLAVYSGTPGDTVVILSVPYRPQQAPPHPIDPPAGTDNPLPSGGTCGPRCIDVFKDADQPLELEVGDLARLEVNGARRLIMIAGLSVTNDTSVAVEFSAHDTLLHQPAGLSGGLLLDRYGTYVQELAPVIYYLDDEQHLMRAFRLSPDGSPDGHVLAYDVESFDASLLFADGDELERAHPFDSDPTNDFDDIVAIRIRAAMTAGNVDQRVNQGELLRKTFEWVASPRNLRYENQGD